MTHYVVGFLFTAQRKSVVLVEKQRPEWQRGKLNGVGGKVETEEGILQAMRREFLEETGVDIPDWTGFAVLSGEGFQIHFFYACGVAARKVASPTDEVVRLYRLSELASLPLIPNARWLIPMALSMEADRAASFLIQEIAA